MTPDIPRAVLRQRWRGTRWHLDRRGGPPLLGLLPRGWAVVGAWNPGSIRRPAGVNRAADRRLARQIAALAPQCRRVVGGRGRWWEDAWAAPLAPATACRLLRRFGQAAGLWRGHRLLLVWKDGSRESAP